MSESAIRLPDAQPCAFCAYLEGSRPFTFVTRNTLTAVMVTQEQRGKPHLLVIPTRHRETILDLTDDECAALMVEVTENVLLSKVAKPEAGWLDRLIQSRKA